MDADDTFKPVFLSTIGRSGTFIIEPAPENAKENNSLGSPTHDQQKATAPGQIKIKTRAQASLENDKRGPADRATKIAGNTEATDRNGKVSPTETETRKNKTGSPGDSPKRTKKVYLASSRPTSDDRTGLAKAFTIGDKIVEPHDTTKNYEREIPDESTKNSKEESSGVSCGFEHPEIEPRRRKIESPGVPAEGGQTKTPPVTLEYSTRNSVDNVIAKNCGIVSPDVHINVQTLSQDVPYSKRNSVDDVTLKNGEIVLSDAQAVPQDDPSRNSQAELLSDSTDGLKTESQVPVDVSSRSDPKAPPVIAARRKKFEPLDVGRITDKSGTGTPDVGRTNTIKSETPDVLTANKNTAQHLTTTSDGKTASPDVYTTKGQIESPDLSGTKVNDDDVDVDGNKPEPEKSQSCSSGPSSPSSKRKKAKGHDLIEKSSIPSLSDGPIEQPKPPADQGASTPYIPRSLTSSGDSNLPSEKLPPIPAPRKSVVKLPYEAADKYVLLYKGLRDRWKVIAEVPKFQSMDIKTKTILQEQADRRLMTPCPQTYRNVEDFKSLVENVEVALKRFYDQEIVHNNHNNYETENANSLPTLHFFQWILPALDEMTQDLLFGCDIMNSRIK